MTQKWAWPKIPPQSPLQLWLAFQVIILTGILRFLLRWVTLPRILNWLTPKMVSTTLNPDAMAITAQYARGILRRFPSNPRGSCLVRSLTLYHFGRRFGYPVHFHCGVHRADGEFKGHAWLSVNREPFWEGGDPFGTHTVTYTYPADGEGKGASDPVASESNLTRQPCRTQESEDSWPVDPSVGFDLQERKRS